MRLCAEDQCLACARTCTPSDVLLHCFGCIGLGRTCGTREPRSKSERSVGGRDVANEPLKRARFFAIDHRSQRLEIRPGCRPQDSNFSVFVRIADANVEEESIELRFGKRMRSFLLAWI